MPNVLKNLKQEDVRRNLEIIKQVVHDLDPTLPVDRGPFHDLVMYYAALFTTANQHDIAEALRGGNLQRLIKNPDKVKAEHVDRVLANWLIKRNPGTTSSGLVTLVCGEQMGFIVPPGTQFTANGHTFKTKATYHVRTSTTQLGEHDRKLVKATGGMWSTTIPIVSITAGATSNLRRGTQIRFDPAHLPQVRKAYVERDFTGGTDEESNKEVLERLPRGLSVKGLNNRMAIDALINDHAKFHNSAVSIIGFGDPEMLRDKHTLWPGSVGGRVDVYVKPLRSLSTKEIKVPGKFVSESEAGVIWELRLNKQQAAGILYAVKIRRDRGGRCKIVNETRPLDNSDARVDIQTDLEAAYTSYQTLVLHVLEPTMRFDKETDATFFIDLRYIDGISALQTHLDDRTIANPASDLLVKAAVPCVMHVEITVQRQPQDGAVKTDAIKEAVTTAINNTGFIGQLPVSMLTQVVTKHLSGTMVIRDITIMGKIRCPDGTIEALSGQVLTIPNKPARLVSPRTVSFFQDQADVHVKAVTVDATMP
jgi:hypothetical protein